MTQKKYPKTAAIIIAFPAMGKTVAAKAAENMMDLDFGMFRHALGCSKKGELSIIPAFVRLIRQYLMDGWVVMTNDPKVIRFLTPEELTLTQVFLPSNMSYASKKMRVPEEQIALWVRNWHEEARSARVSVTYLPVGLDRYIAQGCPPQMADTIQPLEGALTVLALRGEEGTSPTSEFCKNANKARIRYGFRMRDASPGLRALSVEEFDDY